MPLVYAELRKIAARQLRRQPQGAPVEPTDLVHALFVQLVDQRHARWENRAHFYAVAAQMMRRILVDHARARLAAKRGGSAVTVSLSDAGHLAGSSPEGRVCDVLAIDKALERLASRGSRASADRRIPVLCRALRRGDRGSAGSLAADHQA